MRTYHTIKEAQPSGRSSVALGYFDGLHVGHAAVIARAVRRAGDLLTPAVFTFTMHGGHPERKPAGSEILTEPRKYALLEEWGVGLVLSPDFSEFQEMSPEEFADEILVRRLRAAAVCCGHDFRFGRRAAAGVAELAALCDARGIELDIVPAVRCGGERASSSRIRALLGEGNVPAANTMLGRAFGYDFTVVEGKKLGRKIDSPTINQRMPADFVRLRHGVYSSVTLACGAAYPSVTNIGVRPTVDDSGAVNSETYIHGFSGDLYGQNVEVRLLRFLRDEEKFPSVEALKNQIHADVSRALPDAGVYLAGGFVR